MKTELQNRDNPRPREQNLVATSYVAYRVILAIGLLLPNMMPEARLALEIPQSDNFLLVAGIYFATAVMAGLIHVYVDMSTETSARLMLWSDILLLPLLMLVASSLAFSLGLMLAISFALGNSLIPRGVLLRATAASLLVIAALLLQRTLAEGVISYELGGWSMHWGIEYHVDIVNAFVLLVVTTIATVVLLYARQSILGELYAGRIPLFYAIYMLCLGGLLGIGREQGRTIIIET